MCDRDEFEKWILLEWGEPFHDFHGFKNGEGWSYSDHGLNAVWIGYCKGQAARAQQAGSGETDFRAEIRTERDPSDEYVSFLTLVSEGKSSPYMYIPETLDQDVLDEALRRLNTRPSASRPNLTTIAQKKLGQMGATIHGVLVKNEAGAWAAVSDAGRVMWLDDFEGQTVRAQGGEAVAEVTRDHMVGVKFFENTEFGTALEAGTKLYIHPSASVPEGGDPVAWMNQRGEVITDEQKRRLTSNQGIVGAATATNFSIPLVAMEVNNVLR